MTHEITMVERIARAIALTENGDGFDDPWEPFQCHARAVLEALREPTPAMLDAATCARGGRMTVGEASLATWQAMVTAALAEGGG